MTPRGAFGCGDAMFTGGRIRDPMPSGTLTPFPHTMRGRPDHRSASSVPVLTIGEGEGSKRVRVLLPSETDTRQQQSTGLWLPKHVAQRSGV